MLARAKLNPTLFDDSLARALDCRLGLKCRLGTKCRLQTEFKLRTEA